MNGLGATMISDGGTGVLRAVDARAGGDGCAHLFSLGLAP